VVDGHLGLLSVLSPHLAELRFQGLLATGQVVRIEARRQTEQAACPACGMLSGRMHSRYDRRLSDTAIAGREILICLRVRRLHANHFRPAGPTEDGQVQRRRPLQPDAANLVRTGRRRFGWVTVELLECELSDTQTLECLVSSLRRLRYSMSESVRLRLSEIEPKWLRESTEHSTALPRHPTRSLPYQPGQDTDGTSFPGFS
jgi:hypothetical protein